MMNECGFDAPVDKEEQIIEVVSELDRIAYQIAELSRIKEELEKRVSAMLEHGEEGSQTYLKGRYKVTVTTGYIYSVDKEEYEVMKSYIPSRLDPVSVKETYHIDKQTYRDAERFLSQKEKEIFDSMFSKKPAKLSIKVRAAS